MTTNLRETQDMAHNAGVASDDPVVDQANDAKTTRRGNISSESSVFVPGSYDFEQSRLRDLVSKIIASLVGNSRPRARDSSPPPFGSDARVRYDANVHMDREMRSIVKQTLLKSIALLTCFFGKEKSNESLFPMMISFLNERDDWKYIRLKIMWLARGHVPGRPQSFVRTARRRHAKVCCGEV